MKEKVQLSLGAGQYINNFTTYSLGFFFSGIDLPTMEQQQKKLHIFWRERSVSLLCFCILVSLP